MQKENYNDLFVKIRFQLSSFTKSEKKMAEKVLSDYDEVCSFSLTDFAKNCDCSEASVGRFCRKLGLGGFLELRDSLKRVELLAYDRGTSKIRKEDNAKDIFKKIIKQYERTLSDTLVLCDDNLEKVLTNLRKAEKVGLFGIGDAGIVCQYAYVKLQRIGIGGGAYSDPSLAMVCASQLGEKDLAIGISFSGETKMVKDALRVAKKSGAMTACITHFPKSELVKYSDNVIYTATTDFTPGHDEIARRTAEFAIIDTLYMGLVEGEKDTLNEKRGSAIRSIIDNKN